MAKFDTLAEAQDYILTNWSLGPMVVVQELTEDVVSKPQLLNG